MGKEGAQDGDSRSALRSLSSSCAVAGRYVAWFLLVLLAGKMLATSLAIGIGGSGGVFAPSLFLGAMLGTVPGSHARHRVR
jgi:H+/Cl- antiporter ClcA